MEFSVSSHSIGPGHPCYIIAEAGVNHNGDVALARRLVEVARECKADAVKFQTFKAEALVSPGAPMADYQKEATGTEGSQLEMLRKLELPDQAFCQLYATAEGLGIQFLSTPFDEASADFLNILGVPAFKMPSGEITNLPFLAHVARMGKPMIISTGMCWLGEVETAIETIRGEGNSQILLLHCVSQYPAQPQDVNLRAMLTLREAFGLPVGFSDHTQGNEVAWAAVALGACVIEKHFTLDRQLPGPDHRASLEPRELAEFVRGIRAVEASLGHGRKEPSNVEKNTRAVARKSLVAAHDLPAGTVLTEALMDIRRPGTGLAPATKPLLVGRRLRTPVSKGALITLDLLT